MSRPARRDMENGLFAFARAKTIMTMIINGLFKSLAWWDQCRVLVILGMMLRHVEWCSGDDLCEIRYVDAVCRDRCVPREGR